MQADLDSFMPGHTGSQQDIPTEANEKQSCDLKSIIKPFHENLIHQLIRCCNSQLPSNIKVQKNIVCLLVPALV